jgi:uncharacterized membrane protein YdfJ with MMPL/SSD domain
VKGNVTGVTAGSKDFNELMKERIFFVFAFVLGLAFVLLLVTFRSIVIPIKAILQNLLSVTAACGVITRLFQHGHGESLLGSSRMAPLLPACRSSCSLSCSASRWTITSSSSVG